ncbi:MAG: hypothetical protein ACI4L9_01225 [Candidatus Coproplasma sp.]
MIRVLLIIVAVLAVLLGTVAIFDSVQHSKARVTPSYAREDLTEVLSKAVWNEEDYEFLYRQTGLTRQPLDELKGNNARILQFQDALFYEGTISHDSSIPFSSHDMVDYTAPIAPLHTGDVLVSASVHTMGWRNGHAALVIDGARERTVQAVAPGTYTRELSALWFKQASNFMVLRPKDVPQETLKEIAGYARERLVGVKYSLFTGFFSPKDQTDNPQDTHCSHVVWQAYKAFGYDIDENGGVLVTPRDIARCDLFEVVQVYGLDLDELW